MNHDANRAVSLVDLVVTAVVGAIGEEFTKLRADYAAMRLELDRLKSRTAAAEPDRIESDPDGTLAIVYRRAAGTEQRLRLWRPGGWVGVWDIDTAYAVNDTVTHDGSQWLAVSTSRGERPGSSKAWRLIVKHGKDGAGMRYCGDYRETDRYNAGDVVQFGGSAVYVARESGILATPGTPAGRAHWALLIDFARLLRRGKP